MSDTAMTFADDTAPAIENTADAGSQRPEGDGTGEQPKGNREARYRVERNEARAEAAALAKRLVRLQRAEIERLAGAELSHASDLFSLSGNDVADYLNDDGDVDPERVAADVAAILAERPGLRKTSPPGYDPSQGHGGRKPPKAEPSWGALLRY